ALKIEDHGCVPRGARREETAQVCETKSARSTHGHGLASLEPPADVHEDDIARRHAGERPLEMRGRIVPGSHDGDLKSPACQLAPEPGERLAPGRLAVNERVERRHDET